MPSISDATEGTSAPIGKVKTPITAKTDDAVSASGGTYTVAPGRTVIDEDGATKGPGDEVVLNDRDAQRFLEMGFILDSDGSIVVRADGPAINVVDGVQISQPAA